MDTSVSPIDSSLSQLAELVISRLEKPEQLNREEKVSVNPIVSKFATWYEKFRNAMEYREDEVILRAAIERILHRRLLLGGTGKTAAEPLVREIVWARYLPDNVVPESVVNKVEEIIDLYLSFRLSVLEQRTLPQATLDEWVYHLMSSEIENLLNPNLVKETLANFMFQILKDHVEISDDTEETRNAQVYIAVRKAFARDDIAFLRFHLFTLYFGHLTRENVHHIAKDFKKGHDEIERELHYIRKDKIQSYVKRRSAQFLILEDVLLLHRSDLRMLLGNDAALSDAIMQMCTLRYQSIASKIRRAVVRSVAFLLMTKVVFAFMVEGTFERLVYGEVLWSSIILNTTIPPLLMIVVSLFIRIPDQENSKRILSAIREILFSESPRLGSPLMLQKATKRKRPVLHIVFTVLWLLAFLLSFGSVSIALHRLHFTIISQFIFLFFLAIVSFLSYRISLIAHIYTVGEKQTISTPIVDFLFMPVIRVGQRLTQGISQINFFLFIFDFIIETPFKILFTFIEQWFRFLHDKREEIG